MEEDTITDLYGTGNITTITVKTTSGKEYELTSEHDYCCNEQWIEIAEKKDKEV